MDGANACAEADVGKKFQLRGYLANLRRTSLTRRAARADLSRWERGKNEMIFMEMYT
jgi:hypothetical protein